jgi:hypothetical protein
MAERWKLMCISYTQGKYTMTQWLGLLRTYRSGPISVMYCKSACDGKRQALLTVVLISKTSNVRYWADLTKVRGVSRGWSSLPGKTNLYFLRELRGLYILDQLTWSANYSCVGNVSSHATTSRKPYYAINYAILIMQSCIRHIYNSQSQLKWKISYS